MTAGTLLGGHVAEVLAAALTAGRRRTLDLLAPLSDADLLRQHSPLMSPLVWDLGHVANYEELWLLRALTGEAAAHPELDDVYDAFSHPRRERPGLPSLGPGAARAYAADVRARVLDGLGRLDFSDGADRLLASGFVHAMVLQHEHQHDETMLATINLMTSVATPQDLWVGAGAEVGSGGCDPTEILLPGGCFTMGTSTDPWALDNERPGHAAEVAPFWMDATAVTNEAYAAFVASGGYEDQRWWTPAGWAWRQEAGLEHPQFWVRDGDGWARSRFGLTEPLAAHQPVQHVCWYEADAFARWAGKRLPTETEWEYAAGVAPDGTKRRWPWGDADPSPARATLWYSTAPGNSTTPGSSASPPLPAPGACAVAPIDAARSHASSTFGPSGTRAHPSGNNPWGVSGLIGDVWEWTSSDFCGHPAFTPWPYREYSEVFFGPGYKVLRGGSWATDPCAVRATFRNWDLPVRRQIFAGFRCVRDV